MIDISVIIPVYNRGKLIERALTSVLAQTFHNFEIIVVDDGSKDDTISVVSALCDKNDSGVRIFRHSTNLGAQAARNTGVKSAKGKWIAFLDSDDQWLPDSLDKRLHLAREKGVEVIHSDCYIIGSKGEVPKIFGVPPFRGPVLKDLLRRPGPFFQSLLVTKKALESIGYLDETIVSYQEWDTAIRLAEKYNFEFLPDPTFIYYCDHDQTISKNMFKAARGYEQVFTKHMRSILFNLGPWALSTHYLNAANFYREANETVDANRCFLIGGLIWPFRPKALLEEIKRHLNSSRR